MLCTDLIAKVSLLKRTRTDYFFPILNSNVEFRPISVVEELNRPSPVSKSVFLEDGKDEKKVGNDPKRSDRDTTKFLLNLEMATTKSHSKSHPNGKKKEKLIFYYLENLLFKQIFPF
jgi:hypothetical protein